MISFTILEIIASITSLLLKIDLNISSIISSTLQDRRYITSLRSSLL